MTSSSSSSIKGSNYYSELTPVIRNVSYVDTNTTSKESSGNNIGSSGSGGGFIGITGGMVDDDVVVG